MSSMAKTAREAMKAKAKRLGGDRPTEKVDSSTWTPPELLNADVKTGLRPVSRRAFKKGGKVVGEACDARADRKPRKSGGKAITADSLINRNVKEANEDRDGKKHIGGMKKGGRAGKLSGGALKRYIDAAGEDQSWREGMLGSMGDDRKGHAFDAKQKWKMRKREKGMDLADRKLQDKGYTWDNAKGDWKDPDARKSGGRTKRKGRDEGGKVDEIAEFLKKDDTPFPKAEPRGPSDNTPDVTPAQAARMRTIGNMKPPARKSGGRTQKALGGPQVGASRMMREASDTAGVPSSTMQFSPVRSGKFASNMGMKKGGKADKHDDVAADKALIKKMVNPSARTGKANGGAKDNDYPKALHSSDPSLSPAMAKAYKMIEDQFTPERLRQMAETVRQSADKTRLGRKTGGGVFTGSGYPDKVPGVTGGREARATGGKTRAKGKTNINIVIAAGKTPGADAGIMPPGGMPKPPGGIPIPLGPQGGPPQGAAPMPMPVPMPMPAPAGGPAGGPPMGRKAGGRISKVASSYKDMEAGSAGGEGRLQKTDIAKKHKGAPTFKKGGKVYRSYKDMDAGSASGLGRLEKSEIAARKG